MAETSDISTELADTSEKRETRRVLLFISGLAAIFFGIPVFNREVLRSFDAPTHIFFASSYLNGWWDIQEPRWYGGYSKASYPPLVHQLTALTSLATSNLEFAYQLVTWALFIIGPFAAYSFARCFVDRRASIVAALLFVFLPSLRSTMFIFGQVGTYAGLIFTFFSMRGVVLFLRSGRWVAGLSGALLAGCAAASHGNTSIYLLPVTLVVTSLTQFWLAGISFKLLLVRLTMVWVAVALTVFAVVLPFWVWLTNFQVQTPIAIGSRDNYLEHPDSARLFFFDMYGPFLLLALLGIVAGILSRRHIALALLVLLFMVLGLGGTTPLPSLLFGQYWQWLTFERFNTWATCLVLPLVGVLVTGARNKLLFYAISLLSVAMLFDAGRWLSDPGTQRLTPQPLDLRPVFPSFRQYPQCMARYLAFGFDYQLPDLSTYTGARTLDGLWHTARTDPMMRSSGVGALTHAFNWPQGYAVLDAFLWRKDVIPANCIYLNRAWQGDLYTRIIEKHGWRLETEFGNGVSLWLKDGLTPAMPSSNKTPGWWEDVSGYLWGTLPLSCLLLAVLTTASVRLERRRRWKQPQLSFDALATIPSRAAGMLATVRQQMHTSTQERGRYDTRWLAVAFVLGHMLVGAYLLTAYTPIPAGDVAEYFGITESVLNHGGLDLTASDRLHLQSYLSPSYFTNPQYYLAGAQGLRYPVHFFFYSILLIPVRLGLQLVGKPALLCFSLVNFLILALVLYLVARFYLESTAQRLRLVALIYLSPILFFITWQGPDLYYMALLLWATFAFFKRQLLLAALLTVLASWHSQPLMILAAAALAYYLVNQMKAPAHGATGVEKDRGWRRWRWRPLLIVAVLTLAASAPYLYNYAVFGVWSPWSILRDGWTLANGFGIQNASLGKLVEQFFDPNMGLFWYAPLTLALGGYGIVSAIKYGNRVQTLVLLMLMIVVAFGYQTNPAWHYGTAGYGPGRHSIYVLPFFIYFAVRAQGPTKYVSLRSMAVALLIGFQVYPLLFNGLLTPDFSRVLYQSPYADLILRIAPHLYNPTPEIFVDRTNHTDLQYPTSAFFKIDGGCKKVYLLLQDKDRLLQECSYLPRQYEQIFDDPAKFTPLPGIYIDY